MSWFNRFSNLFRRDQVDEELDEELQFHLEARTRHNLNAGMDAEAAQHDARKRFGNATLAKERAHEMNIVLSIETVGRDLRYALRSLLQVAGICGSRDLDPGSWIWREHCGFHGCERRAFTSPSISGARTTVPDLVPIEGGPIETSPGLYDSDYLEYQRQNRAFEQIATFSEDSTTLTGTGDAARVPTAMVTSSFFSVLQVKPALGRGFLPEEEQPGNNHVAVLSDNLWRNRLGADPNILGKRITLDAESDTPYSASCPSGFAFPHEAELWRPLAVGGDRANTYTRPVVGRFRPSVSSQQAMAELEALAKHWPPGPGASQGSMVAEILPLKDLLVGRSGDPC